jgi:hypothetical protein
VPWNDLTNLNVITPKYRLQKALHSYEVLGTQFYYKLRNHSRRLENINFKAKGKTTFVNVNYYTNSSNFP